MAFNQASLNADDLDDEDIWTPSFSPLTEFERDLRCKICQEFFNIPVSLFVCKHAFCSRCIRNHLGSNMSKSSFLVKPHCPCCKTEVDTSGGDYAKAFFPNHQLERVTQGFVQMRDQLKQVVLVGPSSASAVPASIDPQQNGGNDSRRGRSAREAAVAASRNAEDASYHMEDDASDDDDDDVQVVEAVPTRAKKSRRHYNGMKKKKLQEVCREEGLDTSGTEKDLLTRHKEFVNLWNAECDSVQPRSHAAIVAEIHARERSKRRAAGDFAARQDEACIRQLLQLEGAARASTSNPQFDRKLNDRFKSMIEATRQRKERLKSEQPSLTDDDNADEDGNAIDASETSHEDETASTEVGESVRHEGDSREEAVENVEEVEMGAVSDAARPDSEIDAIETPETALSNEAEALSDDGRDNGVDEDFKENQGETLANRESSGAYGVAAAVAIAVRLDDNVSNVRTDQSDSCKPSSDRPTKRRRSTDPGGRLSESGGGIGPWDCPNCTFKNEKHTARQAFCEICRTSRLTGLLPTE